MSASLVGSEMCIRDRGKTSAADARASPGVAPAANKARVRSGASSRAAVSYTHLTLPTICSV
eukprot:13685953-Alexandrium_andersonii.AAC.1